MPAELSPILQKRIRERLRAAIVDERIAPGLQLALGCRDTTLGIFSLGVADPRYKIPVRDNTWFDVASLTKVLSTTWLCMTSAQSKHLELSAPLRHYFPEWTSVLKEAKPWDLLNHRAGLPAIFEQTPELPSREAKIRYFIQKVDESMLTREGEVGKTLYSDVDFMILGILLETIHRKRLRDLLASPFEMAYLPNLLSLSKSGQRLARWLPYSIVSPILEKEKSEKWLQGQVHDPRAQWLDGDAGHAGVFATATGIERWGCELYKAYQGKSVRTSDRVVRKFLDFDSAPPIESSTFLNGFDRPSAAASQSGSLFSRKSTIGHLGFTGASFWMDLDSGIRVTLLSHRFAPGFDSARIREVRPAIHDWLLREVFPKIGG